MSPSREDEKATAGENPPEQSKVNATETEHERGNGPRWHWKLPTPVTLTSCATAVIAVATVVNVLIAALQWTAVRGQLNTMQAVEGAKISAVPKEFGGEKTISLLIENKGRLPSPYLNGTLHILKRNVPKRLFVYHTARSLWIGRIETSPTTYTSTADIDIDPDGQRRIDAGEDRIIVAAALIYDDGFGNAKRHWVCYMYNPGLRGKGWPTCDAVGPDEIKNAPLTK